MSKNFFIILDGPMGAGKTTITKLLSQKLKRTAILSFDEQKWSITDFENGKDSEMIADVRKATTVAYMKYGLNILLDGGFFRGTRMKPFINLANKKGYKLFVYHLEASEKVLVKRAMERPRSHAKAKISQKNILFNQVFHRENHYRGKEVVALDSSKFSATQITNKILRDIKQSR